MRSVVSRTMAAQQAEPRFPSDCRTAALGQTGWTFVPTKQRAKCRAAQTQLMCVFQVWCFSMGTEAPEQCCFVGSWGKVTMKAVRSEGTPLLAKQGCFSFYLYFFFNKSRRRQKARRTLFLFTESCTSFLIVLRDKPSQSKQYGGGTSRAAGSGGCGTARPRLPQPPCDTEPHTAQGPPRPVGRLLVRLRPQHSGAGAGRKGQGPLPRGIPAWLPPHLPARRGMRQRSSRHRRRLPRQPNANSVREGIDPAAPNQRREESGGGNRAAAACQRCLPPPLGAARRAAHLRASRRARRNRRPSQEKL